MLEERKGKVDKHGVPYSEFVLCISPIQVHPPTHTHTRGEHKIKQVKRIDDLIIINSI